MLRLATTRLCPRPASSPVAIRWFWSYLNPIWNQVDAERIKAVGPDRAAAEWLIRCGAKVKWKGHDQYDSNYDNLLRITPKDRIVAIDASDSTVCSIGFPHLHGLQDVEEVIVQRNAYLDDEALFLLKHLQKSILFLTIVSCVNISDVGVKSLVGLDGLKRLYLADLMSVKNASDCLKSLQSALPDCDIICKVR